MARLALLLPLLILGTIFLSIFAANAIHPGEDYRGTAYGMIWGVCFAVVAGALHWAAGWLVNTESTPHGRRWHNRYLLGGLPVQFASLPYAVFGWAIVCYNLGRATSAWVGWPVFLLPAIVALVVVVLRQPDRSRMPRQ